MIGIKRLYIKYDDYIVTNFKLKGLNYYKLNSRTALLLS